MTRSAPLLGVTLALVFSPTAYPADAAATKPIDVTICLDVSSSMDGLINSAKHKLWVIVNDLARAQPTPDLRVAVYSYGHNGYDPKTGWVRKELDLTSDLDEVYRKLTALAANTVRGGDEYVARVCRDALRDQKWSAAKDALRIIFVCGNESAAQDPVVSLADVAAQAQKQGVVINPIFCGGVNDADAGDWKHFALAAGGRFAAIDQERATVAVATPFDKELAELSTKINGTYVAYGLLAREKLANQADQDAAAARLSLGVAAARAETKGGRLYRNADWDLVDKLKEDPKFDVTKVPVEELSEEMKKLKPEERVAYVKKRAEERTAVQKQIAEVTGKRDAFLAEYWKKNPSAAEKAFDEAVRAMLREQAAAKGVRVP